MQPQEPNKLTNKQITYQVGWKKGEIRFDNARQPMISANRSRATSHRLGRVVEQIAWRGLSSTPTIVAYILLFALPVISLIGALSFIYLIMK